MKCTSCSSEINPKWKHAVDTNLCPFCGQAIMDVELKGLLSTLSNTLDALTSYPEYLEDWLRTHGYVHEDKIVKIEAPLTLAPQQAINPSNKDTVAVQNQEVTNQFFKNAEATKAAGRTQQLKEMAQQIKKQGATSLTANPLGAMINPEDLNTADPEVVADLQELIGDGSAIASGLPYNGDDGEDAIPPAALALAQMSGGNGQNNAKDLFKLQQLQSKSKDARNRMLSGSSGKGSFSRS